MTKKEMGLIPKPWFKSASSWEREIKLRPWWVEAMVLGGYKCSECKSGSKRLVVHHIDESRSSGILNNEQSNLILLCRQCHGIRHNRNSGYLLNKKVFDKFLNINNGVAYRGILTDVSKELGITRERARQMYNKLGYTNKKDFKAEDLFCKNCNKKLSEKRTYCSRECKLSFTKNKYWMTSPCKKCGKEISHLKSMIDRYPVFCSKYCQGSYLGSSLNGKKRESVGRWSRVNEVLKIKGEFTCENIMEICGVSYPTTRLWVKELIKKGLIFVASSKNTRGKQKIYQVS